jgi:hypothetical protein
MLRSSTSGAGTKSASKIRMNSPLAVLMPLWSAPALKPVRSVRWTYSTSRSGKRTANSAIFFLQMSCVSSVLSSSTCTWKRSRG